MRLRTASVEVTVQPLPIVSVSGVSICPGGSTVLTATSSDPITWNTSASGPTITVSDAGSIPPPPPTLATQVLQALPWEWSNWRLLTASPSSGVAPLTVQFNSTSTSGATHSWVFNDNGTSNLVSPEHLFEEAGTYTVVLTVTPGRLQVSTSQVIIVTAVPVPIEESSIEVPNVITPNGDRQNDILTVTTANLATFNMQIFNRWGQKMSELTRANQSWDARTLSGEMVSEGTCFYVLVAGRTERSTTFRAPDRDALGCVNWIDNQILATVPFRLANFAGSLAVWSLT
ncbi:MAG: gliding motility-associated C-terminal domain-containing protein [Flavobacteriales bacterium]|nr:gliding motility-associated C-terminal domain-containing protein [Flavobacteriales bacterium]